MPTIDDHFTNRPRVRQPYPDPILQRKLQERQLDAPPIDFHIKGEGMAAITARAALDNLLGTWRSISDLAKNPHTSLGELSEKGWAALNRGLAASDKAKERVEANIKALDAQITTLTQPVISDAMASEIRGLVRSDSKQAMTLVRSDARVASAILRGPAALSGLDQAQHEKVREIAELTFAPGEAKLRKESQDALSVLEAAQGRALAVVGGKLSDWKTKAPPMEALNGS